MKKNLLTIIIICLISIASYAQKVELKGSNFSYAKGDIDLPVLNELIQQKQLEVAQHFFWNGIISTFKGTDKEQRSFTTYHFAYNLLKVLTEEKNKTVITKKLINSMIEYAIISQFTINFIKEKKIQVNGQVAGTDILTILRARPVTKDGEKRYFLKNLNKEEWLIYNKILDRSLSLFLKANADGKPQGLQEYGLFTLLKDQSSYEVWYDRDQNDSDEQVLTNFDNELKGFYDSFISDYKKITDIYKLVSKLEKNNFEVGSIDESEYQQLKVIFKDIIAILKNYSNNNTIATVCDFLLDYTIVEKSTNDNILYIEAEGLISAVYDHFVKRYTNRIYKYKAFPIIPRPFINIGASHSIALNNKGNHLLETNGGTKDLKSIYFASEKIGVKFTFFDNKYTRSFEPGEEFKYFGTNRYWKEPQKEKTISRMEFYLYGSGLLYNLVDVKTEKSFNYTLVGGALGFYFFNGLMLNVGASVPVNTGQPLHSSWMANLSFDIPIVDYINALSKKNK
jgi:hypothetical protein